MLSEPLIALILVMGCDWVLVGCGYGLHGGLGGRPLAAPGIPRSLRSRPFRPTKGAVRVVVMGSNGGLGGSGRFETCSYGLVEGVSNWVSSRR